MTEKYVDKKYPDCFGHLEIVFPKGKHGLRDTPQTCLPCSHKTQCLRSAMQGADGLKSGKRCSTGRIAPAGWVFLKDGRR